MSTVKKKMRKKITNESTLCFEYLLEQGNLSPGKGYKRHLYFKCLEVLCVIIASPVLH